MSHRIRVTATWCMLGLPAGLVWWVSPNPRTLAPALHDPQGFVDRVGADRAALALVGVLCWLVLAWLAVGLAFSAAAALPGAAGRFSELVADRVLPDALRQVAAVALGFSMATVGSTAAISDSTVRPRTAQAATLALDWPTGRQPGVHSPDAGRPGIDWPAGEPPPRAGHPPPHPRPAVVVRPGDCLWTIAARHLGPDATDARIAAEWPRWYVANRAVIGPDPSLIYPGQRLVLPRSGTEPTP